jgi:rubredoxin
LRGPGSYSRYSGLNLMNPRVVVAADQLEDAQRVLSQPVPEEIVEKSKTTVPEFELPVCPKCGVADPALEGVDLFNTWRCEACGYQWTESEADANQDAVGME